MIRARNWAVRHADYLTSLGCQMPGISPFISFIALDFLAVWSDQIERAVFLRAVDLFRLDVDLIF